MKLSKSLLQAIMAGITIAAAATATTSCTKAEELIDRMEHRCNENCTETSHPENGGAFNPGNCPACGMG